MVVLRKRTDAERMLALFHGRDTAHGVYRPSTAAPNSRGKVRGKQSTELGPPTTELWEGHLKGTQGLGTYMLQLDGTVRFAAIDVDVYPLDHAKLAEKVKAAGIPLTVCASKSGGAHLYLFGKEPLPATIVRAKMTAWAQALWLYDLKQGRDDKVEFFPHKDTLAGDQDFGKYLNMPYFGGERTAIDDTGRALTLAEFLDQAAKVSVTPAELSGYQAPVAEALRDGPPCLQTLLASGPVEEYRDNTLFNLGVYLRQREPDAWEPALEEYHRNFIADPLPSRDVLKVIKTVGRKDYVYMCNQEPLQSRCNSAVCITRKFGVRAAAAKLDDADPGGFSLNLGQLTKFTSEPPVWELEVDGQVLRLSTEQLMSYTMFRKVALETLNILPTKLKDDTWHKIVTDKLSTLELEEAPPDAGDAGQLRWHLERFCVYLRARAKEELKDGRPWWDDENELVYFRAPHVLEYLVKHRVYLSPRELVVHFRKWGFKHGQFNLRGVCVQWWSMPTFEVQNEADDIPRPGLTEGAF